MFNLQPLRHISTLPETGKSVWSTDGFEGLAEIGRLLLVEICRIPKVVQFVLSEPRRRDGYLASLDRMRKYITILMRSRLRLALARVQCIHAIQAARRAECPK
jgi:hypothetical protein